MSALLADAISAYSQAAKQPGPGLDTDAPVAGGSFADLLKDVGADALQAGRHADRMSVAALDGEASVTEVVTAIANAEIALQTVIAVRDRVIEAYQEILRMPM